MSDIGLDSYWDGRASSKVGADDDGMLDMSMWDLPMESLEGEEFLENWDPSHLEFMGPIQLDFLTPQPTVPHENISAQHSLAEMTTIDAIEETTVKKQLPSYVEESSSAPLHSRNEFTSVHQAQSSVSMLESSGSNSTGENLPIKSSTKVPVRSRSERVRALGKNPWRLITLATNPPSQSTSNFTKSEERRKTSAQQSVAMQASNMRPNCEAAAIRECSHCGITRTPQWREGPLGRKTLCNACGVRYRSGRLLPEYRPAASPTFVPSLHSNSHKKVIEMRRKANGM